VLLSNRVGVGNKRVGGGGAIETFLQRGLTMKKAMLLLSEQNRDRIYGDEQVEQLRSLVDLKDCCCLVDDRDALKRELGEVEIILSGWGMVRLDGELLDAAPKLSAVFYGAGSVRGFVTEEFWARGILLTSASPAIAVTVARTTVALIVVGLRKMLQSAQLTRARRRFARADGIKGLWGASVGIIGVGQIGARVLEMLKDYEVETFCHDPFLGEERARELGATPIGLDDMFRRCDVVSVHAANLPSTEHMVTGSHFRSMKDGAVFINTARGRTVKEDEMIEVLKEGRIFAFIDVTDPEPPEPDSPLYELSNVFLTPHMAGSVGEECRRQGAYVVEEVRRYCQGQPPLYPVTREMMEWMA